MMTKREEYHIRDNKTGITVSSGMDCAIDAVDCAEKDGLTDFNIIVIDADTGEILCEL